jgi:L-methionine (R)-S-oxide reductase
MFTASPLSGSKAEQYEQLIAQCQALLHGERHRVANAANLSALLFNNLSEVNWLGFYFLEQGELIVGPFQGLPACVRIAALHSARACAARRHRPAKPSWLRMYTPSRATSPVIRLRSRKSWCR